MPDLVSPDRRPPDVNSTSLGMTEMCSSHTLWDQYDPLPESRRGTFGKSLPGITHKVVDPATGADVPVGDDGELWARGYSLMQGLQRREREEVFEPDGWYRTGDAGHFDADGWFYFTGRLGEMIKTPGGANVTPAEVEIALDGLSRRARGLRHRHPGRRTADSSSWVPSSPGAAKRSTATNSVPASRTTCRPTRCRKHLWVCAKSDLPFLDSGKIKKQELAELLAARYADD